MISTIETFEDYDNKVAAVSKTKPVVLQFFATWCGPCQMLKPVMEGIAHEDDRWDLVFIDIDQHMDKALEFNVRSVPKVVLVSEGKEVSNFVGGQPKHMIQKWLDEHLPQPAKNEPEQVSTDKATTFLMFSNEKQGKAEEAMRLYTSLFENSNIDKIDYFKEGEQGGKAGEVKQGFFQLAGQRFIAHDSAMEQNFTFTPSISIHMSFSKKVNQENAFAVLSEGGKVLLPLDHYGFSEQYAWIEDKYGISWQLNFG